MNIANSNIVSIAFRHSNIILHHLDHLGTLSKILTALYDPWFPQKNDQLWMMVMQYDPHDLKQPLPPQKSPSPSHS
jgi:hypothetical protein